MYGEEPVHLPSYQDQVLLVLEQFYAALLVQDKKLCSDELLGDVADHTFMVGGGVGGAVCYISPHGWRLIHIPSRHAVSHRTPSSPS